MFAKFAVSFREGNHPNTHVTPIYFFGSRFRTISQQVPLESSQVGDFCPLGFKLLNNQNGPRIQNKG